VRRCLIDVEWLAVRIGIIWKTDEPRAWASVPAEKEAEHGAGTGDAASYEAWKEVWVGDE